MHELPEDSISLDLFSCQISKYPISDVKDDVDAVAENPARYEASS